MFVLPVARLIEPCSRHAAISFWVLTSTSVDPESVIMPFDDSRICTGDFPGIATFPTCPLQTSTLQTVVESSKSLTSSFRILTIQVKFMISNESVLQS